MLIKQYGNRRNVDKIFDLIHTSITKKNKYCVDKIYRVEFYRIIIDSGPFIDLYDTITGTPSIESSDKVIIPGDKGSFVLTATGVGSSSDIEYTIMFNGSSTPSNTKFYLDEAKTKALDVETNKMLVYGRMLYFVLLEVQEL